MVYPYYDYDEIAETIFYPAYDEIIDRVIDIYGVIDGSFLDIGCGGGHLGFALMKRTAMKGSFVDIQPGAVKCTRARARDLGFEERSTVYQADVACMPFADNSFDLIISRGTVPFWEDQKKAFEEILRVMKPGGKAYIGGGLGSLQTQKEIEEKMKARGKSRYGHKKSADKVDHALTLEGYREMFAKMPCKAQVISNEESRRLILLEKL